jgi:hypothetical protein
VTTTADRRRAQVVELVTVGHAVDDVASKLSVTARHVRRILAEPEIKAQIRELETERLRAVARRAAALGGGAVTVLATIATDKVQPAAARVSAARALLDTMLRVGELADLSERISQLEERFMSEGAR